ncbi:MAG: hypothetical protein LIO75_03305, partial [Lachnospiraceae bacterium]|nr:hypothetical protein [Lachnospiraceae bacterium]
LVGDWDSDGCDTLCARRSNIYYFSNEIADDSEVTRITYGRSQDTVYVGDWDNDGVDTLCVRR